MKNQKKQKELLELRKLLSRSTALANHIKEINESIKKDSLASIAKNLQAIKDDLDNYLDRFRELALYTEKMPENTEDERSFKKAIIHICVFHTIFAMDLRTVDIKPVA